MVYGKWFQTEVNDIKAVDGMVISIKLMLARVEEMSKAQVWELVRCLGYLNHSAFKVRPGMWEKYPDEMLTDEDKALNDIVYNAKNDALEILIPLFIKNGWDIKTDEKRSMVLFRNPVNGVRQITFHVGKDSSLLESISDCTGTFDGVRQAHRYDTDEKYTKALAA